MWQVGHLVHGVVVSNRPDRQAYVVALQGVGAGVPALGVLPHQAAARGYRIHDTVVAVVTEFRGTVIMLSQRCAWYYRRISEFVLRPLVDEGVLAIRRVASSPRARFFKLAVEPVSRVDNVYRVVQPVMAEFKKYTAEVPCVVQWFADKQEFVIEALKPADAQWIERCEMFKEAREATLYVARGHIGKVLGPGGMNVALAAKLTRYRIEVREAGGRSRLVAA